MESSLADAITWVFGLAVPVGVVALVLALLLKEVPLRTTTGGDDAQPPPQEMAAAVSAPVAPHPPTA